MGVAADIDDKGQPVTTNVAVTVQAPKLDAQGKPLMTNGVAVMEDVPKLEQFELGSAAGI